MFSSKFFVVFSLLVALLLTAGSGLAVQSTQGPSRQTNNAALVSLDFKDIELTDLVQTISELTGRNFVYDDQVKGKATIISPKKLTLDEAYNLFLTVLNVKGYTVVPSGEVNKIIPIKDAKESNLPTRFHRGEGEQFITRLVPLENIDATVVASTVLAPLIPKTSNIVAYPQTNTLIITDNAANIQRLVDIIKQLDVRSSSDVLEVIPLQFASATDVAKICSDVISQVTSTPRRGRPARNVQTAGDKDTSRVLAFERTNSLVVMANAEDMATVKGLVAKLDQRPPQQRSHINVYYLENADAETLAGTLNEIITGIKTQARQGATGATRGQPPNQAAALASEQVSITFDKPTNSLIINSTPEDYEILRGIIKELDIKRKQVFVEALILELSMDATEAIGASLQGAVATSNDGAVFGTSNLNTGNASLSDLAATSDSGVPSLLGKTINGLLLGGMFNPITVTGPDGKDITVPALSVLIDLSQSDTDINVLSAPRLLTSDNEEAEIIVGQNVPIITNRLTDTGSSSGLAQSVSVERQDVALTLRFTPQVTEGDLVRLNVFQEITNVAPSNPNVGSPDQVGPTLTKRSLTNTVLAENGKTVVLGGLIDSNTQDTVSKTPFLGDLPLIGWLFRHKSTTEKKTNLLIFMTPHIIRNAEDLDIMTQKSQNSMRRFQQEEMRTSINPLDSPVLHYDQPQQGNETGEGK